MGTGPALRVPWLSSAESALTKFIFLCDLSDSDSKPLDLKVFQEVLEQLNIDLELVCTICDSEISPFTILITWYNQIDGIRGLFQQPKLIIWMTQYDLKKMIYTTGSFFFFFFFFLQRQYLQDGERKLSCGKHFKRNSEFVSVKLSIFLDSRCSQMMSWPLASPNGQLLSCSDSVLVFWF